jgi:hypothetical protein
MNQNWKSYVEEFEDLEEREMRKAYKNRSSKKLDHEQEKKLKEKKKNEVQYPKKSKR